MTNSRQSAFAANSRRALKGKRRRREWPPVCFPLIPWLSPRENGESRREWREFPLFIVFHVGEILSL
jgi:hypothetical protein